MGTIRGSACREAEQNGSRLIRTRQVIRSHLGCDSRRLPLITGQSVVESLENPSERVDAHFDLKQVSMDLQPSLPM